MTDQIKTKNFNSNSLRKQIKADYVKNKKLIEGFHKLFYESQYTWRANRWLGNPILKAPSDIWMLQELVFEVRPQLIIETGTAFGGSALFMATILDYMWQGNYKVGGVITIDIDNSSDKVTLPKHPRIQYITADSTDPKLIAYLKDTVKLLTPVMVVLDSLHLTDHVLQELRLYSPFVTKGSFLIVEDTNLGELAQKTITKQHGRIGPMLAVEKFLKENKEFKSEILCERFHLTFHPKGWLTRT